MKKIIYSLMALLVLTTTASAQRTTDLLDRGLVATPASSGNFVSWRIMGEEYYDVTYNLYCNGAKIASNLQVSNYTHTSGNASSSYQVAAVVRGVEQKKCSAVTRWSTIDGNGNYYLPIKTKSITDRAGLDATSDYQLNDVSLADLNGDGIAELIVKRPCDVATDTGQNNRFHVLDCYDIKGNRLWWIDLGPNMQAEADEQWDAVAYDWDGDGKAEVLMRGADNMIIHHSDGTTTNIGSMTTDHRANGGLPYCSVGNEYLLYLEGATAKPYQIGESSHPDYLTYPLTRGLDSDWGTGIVGHRSTKHFFGAPFLDGRHPSIFLGRGIYTKHKAAAYDVDPATHKLTQRWYWECNASGPWFGQGNHNYAVADVDWDGRDEMIFGSMVIDDNGKGLSTCGLGHGDAQHCGDLDPYRKGQEQFACNESSPNMNYRNATTSEFYYRSVGTGDDGRALMGNFSNSYPGCVGRSVNTGMISSVADKPISELGDFIAWNDLNFRLYWDGDLCEEILNSPGTERDAIVIKPGSGRIFQSGGVKMCNWSKNNPCATGDIIGDWREEIILRNADNTELRIYTTPYSTKYRNYTLWHDHQYRQGMVWECLGYNQPPHASYFLGEMEGITLAPPPLTMTGREEVPNGGIISNEDKHFIVCEPNDTKVSIADGASPYIVTFNVPSWVQGTASSNSTTKNTKINYTYYICDVTGGALTGNTRLIKQGDGILNLPKVDMTHTGETNIWAGTLNFDGSMKNSPLWLNRFAELNSDGGTFRSIKADYASVIRPGGADKVGIINADTLELGFGSRLILDLYGENIQSDAIHTKLLSIERKTGTAWTTYGPAYLQPVIEVVPHREAGTNILTPGNYLIATAENITGKLDNIKIEGLTTEKAKLIQEEKNIYLVVEGVRDAGIVYWTGSENTTWDKANTENFQNAEGEKDIFVMGDKVVLDGASSKTNINLEDEVSVDSLVVRSNKNYTISGTGKIVGGALLKQGNGTLTMKTDNTYTGGNFLQGGTVSVSVLSNDVLTYGNLGGVTTSATKFVMQEGATLLATASVTNGSPISFKTSEGGVINNSADFVQQKAFSGTLLTKKGDGWLKTQTAGTSLNRMVIMAGTVQNGNGNAAKVIEFQGGALVDNVGTDCELNVPAKKKGTWTTANRQTYSNKLTGEGTLTAYCAAEQGSGWVATRTPLKLNLSSFQGTLVPGATISADGRFTLDTSSGGTGWTLDIPSGVTVQNSGKILKIGTLTGKGDLGGYASFSNSGSASANTWTVGNETDFTFDGKVVGSDKFTKAGTGKMTVKGLWETTGAITVSAGELCINNTNTTTPALGTAALTINKGATLSGKGVIGCNVTIPAGATIRSGISETNTAGNLRFAEKTLTVNGTMQTCISTKSSFSKFTEIGILKLNGTLKVMVKEGSSLAEGTELQIIEASNITLGSSLVLDLDPGYTWDTSKLDQGILIITGTTALQSITADELGNASIYTLSGVKVDHPVKGGVYIVNGQKKVVK